MSQSAVSFYRGFMEKVNDLAEADHINEQLRAKVIYLEAENARLRRKVLGEKEALRAEHVHANAKREAGNPLGRVERSLVPELFEKKKDVAAHGHAKADAHHETAAEVHDAHADVAKADSHHGGGTHGEPEVDAEDAEHGHGDDHGRAPASVHAAEPMSILSAPPKKVYEEAVKAMAANDFHRAARGFVALAGNKENTRYATPEVNLYAGIALFNLQNYGAAEKYFENAYEKSKSGSDKTFPPKALSWLAFSYKKLGKTQESKKAVQVLIETYPKSPEARRVH